jgi:aspartate carbamoyltransferase catalytic subunit
LILEQVTNGLAVRMAVLFLLNGGKGPQGVAGN